MEWLEVSVQVEAEVAEAVAEVFARYAPQGVAIDLGQDGQTVTVKAYLPVDEHLEERKRKVNEALGHLNHIWPVIPEAKFTPIAERDWTAEWKESIPVLHIGQRIVIIAVIVGVVVRNIVISVVVGVIIGNVARVEILFGGFAFAVGVIARRRHPKDDKQR